MSLINAYLMYCVLNTGHMQKFVANLYSNVFMKINKAQWKPIVRR